MLSRERFAGFDGLNMSALCSWQALLASFSQRQTGSALRPQHSSGSFSRKRPEGASPHSTQILTAMLKPSTYAEVWGKAGTPFQITTNCCDACRSNAKLERLLDWLLAIYKLAFPVLVSTHLAKRIERAFLALLATFPACSGQLLANACTDISYGWRRHGCRQPAGACSSA